MGYGNQLTILHSQTEAFLISLFASFPPRSGASEIGRWAQAIYTGLQEEMSCQKQALVNVGNWRSWELYTPSGKPPDYLYIARALIPSTCSCYILRSHCLTIWHSVWHEKWLPVATSLKGNNTAGSGYALMDHTTARYFLRSSADK